MEKPVSPSSLQKIRSEIDAVDEAMLKLLARRFAAIDLIKEWKRQDPTKSASPVRPAREAEILRRLLALNQGPVPSDLVVRLWRSIIAAATREQGEITVHVAKEAAQDQALRDAARDHFGFLAFEEQAGADQLTKRLADEPQDIGVVSTRSGWIEPLLRHRAVRVMGTLPLLRSKREAPLLLILGQARPEPTGDDETLIAIGAGSRGSGDFLWQANAGYFTCVAVEGFLDDPQPHHGAAARILGRSPCPLAAPS
ncbi:MAG TPA: chorismate mutase [Aestuariivirgaceae bacterium]|jgi:chorismate mutase